MAENLEVLCITKSGNPLPYACISHFGGTNGDGSRWRLTAGETMAGMKAGQWRFFVRAGGKSVWVIVARHLGREYLKTEADDVAPKALLHLPECPHS